MAKRTLKPDRGGYINGFVKADPCDFLTDEALERWLTHLSVELTGNEMLSDITYKPVSVRKGEINYRVSGSTEFMDELDAKMKGA